MSEREIQNTINRAILMIANNPDAFVIDVQSRNFPRPPNPELRLIAEFMHPYIGIRDGAITSPLRVYKMFYTNQLNDAQNLRANARTEAERIAATQMINDANAALRDIRALAASGQIKGAVHDVPVFRQGPFRTCWAVAQVMVEAWHGNPRMTQGEANIRVVQLGVLNAIVRDPGFGSTIDWNRGASAWDDSAPFISRSIPGTANNLESQMITRIGGGPLFAAHRRHDGLAGHMTVVAGVVSAPGHPTLVVLNNPWERRGILTFDDFLTNYPAPGEEAFDSNLYGPLRTIYVPTLRR